LEIGLCRVGPPISDHLFKTPQFSQLKQYTYMYDKNTLSLLFLYFKTLVNDHLSSAATTTFYSCPLLFLTPCKRPLDAWSEFYETTHIVIYNRYAGKTIPFQNIDVSGTVLERNLLWFYSPKRPLPVCGH